MKLWNTCCLIPLVFVAALKAQELPVVLAESPKSEVSATGVAVSAKKRDGKAVAYVIPVQNEIGKPTLYILRRGLKEAIEQKADVVVLDMKTPGGALDVTFDIMEALGKFPGRTVTFVNDQAISAGAFISATTEEIWFAPKGKIGAAAPVNATGQDIDKTMRQKVVSFLRAEVRAISEGKGHRGQVVSAMIDEDFELKIGDTVLKPKGELLTLTASEAMKTYGEPAQPLLGAGIAANVNDLLTKKFGAGNFEVRQFRVTWSESLAQYLTALAPVLMGLGGLLLFIEFKTPGFGWPGVTGLTLLAIVFFGHYVAGLSGHEPALLFAVGALLLAAEFFLFPGVIVSGLVGVALMLGSLVWAMTDVWPQQPMTFSFSGDALLRPLLNLAAGLVIAAGGAAVLLRYLPQASILRRVAVGSEGTIQISQAASATGGEELIGQSGRVVVTLRPVGVVELAGCRYEARVELGEVVAGSKVRVVARRDFTLLVEKIS